MKKDVCKMLRDVGEKRKGRKGEIRIGPLQKERILERNLPYGCPKTT